MKRIYLIITLCFVVQLSFAQKEQSKATESTELMKGQSAPDFSIKDQNGKTIELDKMLNNGAVVLLFYRGAWCPYCRKQLSELQESLGKITEKNASVIAITPSSEENIKKMVKKTGAKFHIGHDTNGKIMKAYGVDFQIEEKMRKKYLTYGINFNKVNKENGDILPIPAVYVIDKSGKIVYTFFNPDYSKRPSVEEIIKHLP